MTLKNPEAASNAGIDNTATSPTYVATVDRNDLPRARIPTTSTGSNTGTIQTAAPRFRIAMRAALATPKGRALQTEPRPRSTAGESAARRASIAEADTSLMPPQIE